MNDQNIQGPLIIIAQIAYSIEQEKANLQEISLTFHEI